MPQPEVGSQGYSSDGRGRQSACSEGRGDLAGEAAAPETETGARAARLQDLPHLQVWDVRGGEVVHNHGGVIDNGETSHRS